MNTIGPDLISGGEGKPVSGTSSEPFRIRIASGIRKFFILSDKPEMTC
jgi:hypothetical protein